MKKIQSVLALVASLLIPAGSAFALTLAGVPYYQQQQNEWCWNASSEMVLGFYGVNVTQTNIAAYACGGSNVPNYLTGTHAASGATPARLGVDIVLRHFGNVGSTFYNNALSSAQLQTEINASNLAIIAIGWSKNNTGPFVWNAGGHAVVLYGFDGTTVDIDDPWPANGQFMQTFATLQGGAAGTYRPGSARFMWEQTLVTASSLDAVIQIDSTGSMSDEINAVVPQAVNIVSNLFSLFRDARVAVVDYKDYPNYSGDDTPGDYIANTDQIFTTNISAITSAITGIANNIGGGGDIPEAVYSALYLTLQGTNVGGWRPDPVKRIIIDIGDAGGHDPVEPWPGGHSIADVVALASTPGNLINIFTIPCAVDFGSSYDPQCIADFAALSVGSGGASFPAGSGGDLDTNISDIVQQTFTNNRAPAGPTPALQPVFTFTQDGGGMFDPPSYYEIQILKSNLHKGTFSTYLSARVHTNIYTPAVPMPTNTYRWRVGFAQPASKIVAPDGTKLDNLPATISYDNQYTEFQREQVLPTEPQMLTPAASETNAVSFTSTNATLTYSWTSGVAATSYAVSIYSFNAKTDKYTLWKRLTVKPPPKTPTVSSLSVKVGGHKVNATYGVMVESLNYDHPRPTLTLVNFEDIVD